MLPVIPRVVVRGNEGSRKGFINEIPRRRTEECPFWGVAVRNYGLRYRKCGKGGSGLGSAESSEQHTQKEAKKHEGAMQIEMQDSLCFLTTL